MEIYGNTNTKLPRIDKTKYKIINVMPSIQTRRKYPELLFVDVFYQAKTRYDS